jgi:NitT/TauT family transport system permease protein
MRIARWPLLLALVLWQLASWCSPGSIFPSPIDVARGLRDVIVTGTPPGHVLYLHMYYSLGRVICGYLLAAVVAIPLGLATGVSQQARSLVCPFVDFFRPIPPLAWVPLAILWFGVGTSSAAFLIFMGAFFPILLNTMSGVMGIDSVYIDVARTLDARPIQIMRKVVLPAALPSILTGLRVGMGIGWMTLVAAELVDVRDGYGLGYLIMTARDLQRYNEVCAGMLTIGLLGLLLDKLFVASEKIFLSWREPVDNAWKTG